MTKISDAEMTDRMRCALRKRFGDRDRFALLEEVGDATGSKLTGWADAVAMQLWPSDGLQLWGFELKASRGDWKKELANPKKSEKISRHCDRWIVLAPKGLVRVDELPPTWGLWEYDTESDEIRQKVHGEERKAVKYLHRGFLASLIRRTAKTLPSAAYVARIAKEIKRETDREYSVRLEDARRENQRRAADLDALREAMRTAGIRYDSWSKQITLPAQTTLTPNAIAS